MINSSRQSSYAGDLSAERQLGANGTCQCATDGQVQMKYMFDGCCNQQHHLLGRLDIGAGSETKDRNTRSHGGFEQEQAAHHHLLQMNENQVSA